MALNSELASRLVAEAKAAKIDESDADKIAQMVLCDLFGISYAESKRGRKVDLDEKRFDLEALDNKIAWYQKMGRKIPQMVTDERAAIAKMIADAEKAAPIPVVITAQTLTNRAARLANNKRN